MYDIIIVGSGPAGLSCALSAKKRGLNYLILEKGCITNTIYNFPISMIFFTTRELIEIGDYPLTILNIKPTREEAIRYYAKFVIDNKININTNEEVIDIKGSEGDFQISSKNFKNENQNYSCKKVVIATGVYDNPIMLNILGEKLNKVTHFYKEAHPYVGKEVLVIGGANSSAETALDLHRFGAKVTLCVRDNAFKRLKYWIKPDIINRIEENSIKCYYNSNVTEINDQNVVIKLSDGTSKTIQNDFVIALTGYQPNHKLLKSVGVEINSDNLKPKHNTKSLETNIPGIFVAGVITAGSDSSLVFIENGRFHGEQIISNI